MIRTNLMRTIVGAALVVAIPGASVAQDAATPEDAEWHLTSYGASGELTPVPWTVDATLTLADGAAGGNNGCNQFSGSYTLDGQALILGDEFLVAQKACFGDAAAVEEGYMAALPNTASWAMSDGSLQLSDAEGVVILTYEQAVAALTAADITAIAAAFEAQQAELDKLEKRLDSVKIGTLRSRIKELEDQVKALQSQASSPGGSADSSPGGSFNSAEQVLLKGIPAAIRQTCEPRRSQNPAGTIAAVQCQPNASEVRDMAYYLMNGNAAQDVFSQRMSDNGVTRSGLGCWNGNPSQIASTGNFEVEGCYVNDDGRANIRIAEAAAGCSQLRVDGQWIKRPALYVAVLGQDDDISKLARWVYPRRISEDRITRSIPSPNAPASPFCPT